MEGEDREISGGPAGDQRRGKKIVERESQKGKEMRRWQSQDSGTVTEKEKERGVRMVYLSKVASEKGRGRGLERRGLEPGGVE
jgi:hypothetical protein